MYSGYRVELIDVCKSFGGIKALQKVTLRAKEGEIHALVGENGAGKSTLVKILSGACKKDSGLIKIGGVDVEISNPKSARKAGIGIIYQEFSLVPELSVSENIFLHTLSEKKFFIDRREMNKNAIELINHLGFKIDPDTKVKDLSIANQQIVEIAKAFSENLKILILDEPTAVLAQHETTLLFSMLKGLKKKGVTIIYISHRLEEVFSLADMVTVLKDGETSGSFPISKVERDDIIKLMIGRRLNSFFPVRNNPIGDEIFKVENICIGEKVKNVTFSVNEGEIFGITGLVGSGRTEILRAIFAADRKVNGEVKLNGKNLRIRNTVDAVRAGLGFVPEDRKNQGVILGMSVKSNISLTNLQGVSGKIGNIKKDKEIRHVLKLISKLAIKVENPDSVVADLSGGNQQKVILAKWLGINCKVLLLDEPTRGVDIGAKVEIYDLVNELARSGVCIIMISSEILEVMGLCDRILVMREGTVQGIIEKDQFSEESILKLAVGF